ncbi:MAG: hypothetical protein ACYCW6_05920 [Candidatus Xenobia bacterium]
METFREACFAKLDTQMATLTTQMAALTTTVVSVREELQAIRGGFAGIEAILIAHASQTADLVRRVEALEAWRKAS